jgi:hypothetical protein
LFYIKNCNFRLSVPFRYATFTLTEVNVHFMTLQKNMPLTEKYFTVLIIR